MENLDSFTDSSMAARQKENKIEENRLSDTSIRLRDVGSVMSKRQDPRGIAP